VRRNGDYAQGQGGYPSEDCPEEEYKGRERNALHEKEMPEKGAKQGRKKEV
jgi:hypothetical protein